MSMEFRVKLTNYAIEQMQETVSYISKVLQSPDVARGWSDKLMKELSTLKALPSRYVLVEDEPWHTEGIHRMVIQNFIAYYWVDESTMTVWITAIIYGRRDQLSALQRMPIDK